MAQPEQNLFGDLRAAINRVAADTATGARLRWHLAQIELEAAIAQIRRLAIWTAVAAALVAISLPVGVVLLAELIALLSGTSVVIWLAIFFAVLAIGGALAGWFGWQHFRARFTGFEQTLEELREDLRWLEDWVGRAETAKPATTEEAETAASADRPPTDKPASE